MNIPNEAIDREALEDELMEVLRTASKDRYRHPSLRELAQAALDAGYRR